MKKDRWIALKLFWFVSVLIAILILARPAAAQEDTQSSGTVHAAITIGPAVAVVTALGTKSLFDWLYVNISSRGMIVYTRSLSGNDSSAGGVIKTLTWRPRGLDVATLAIGADFGRDGAQVRPITFDSLSLYVGVPFNLLNVTRSIWNSESFKRNFSLLKLPKGLDLWYGPGLSIPPGLALSKLRIDRDLRHFVSLGKKF